MTLDEKIAKRYNGMRQSDIDKRKADYELNKRNLSFDIANMHPRVAHSPAYLEVERLAAPLMKHTYGDIAKLGWAFEHVEGFSAVKTVAEEYGLRVDMHVPDGADKRISPIIFYGDIWGVFKQYNVIRYTQLLRKHFKTSKRELHLSDAQLEAIKARGIYVKYSPFELYFEPYTPDYIEQYETKGYVIVRNYIRSTAEAIEKLVQQKYPGASLQFDRELGVVIR